MRGLEDRDVLGDRPVVEPVQGRRATSSTAGSPVGSPAVAGSCAPVARSPGGAVAARSRVALCRAGRRASVALGAHATRRDAGPETSAAPPVASRCRQAAVATTRHQASGGRRRRRRSSGRRPRPSARPAVRAVDRRRRRRPAPGGAGRGRPGRRRRTSGAARAPAATSCVEAGHAGHHQQASRSRPCWRPRCRCRAGRRRPAAARRRPGAASPRTAAAPACRRPPGRARRTARPRRPARRCRGPGPSGVGTVRSVLEATHGSPSRTRIAPAMTVDQRRSAWKPDTTAAGSSAAVLHRPQAPLGAARPRGPRRR